MTPGLLDFRLSIYGGKEVSSSIFEVCVGGCWPAASLGIALLDQPTLTARRSLHLSRYDVGDADYLSRDSFRPCVQCRCENQQSSTVITEV